MNMTITDLRTTAVSIVAALVFSVACLATAIAPAIAVERSATVD